MMIAAMNHHRNAGTPVLKHAIGDPQFRVLMQYWEAGERETPVSSSPYGFCDNFMEFFYEWLCINSTPLVLLPSSQGDVQTVQGLCSSTTSGSRAFVNGPGG